MDRHCCLVLIRAPSVLLAKAVTVCAAHIAKSHQAIFHHVQDVATINDRKEARSVRCRGQGLFLDTWRWCCRLHSTPQSSSTAVVLNSQTRRHTDDMTLSCSSMSAYYQLQNGCYSSIHVQQESMFSIQVQQGYFTITVVYVKHLYLSLPL